MEFITVKNLWALEICFSTFDFIVKRKPEARILDLITSSKCTFNKKLPIE